MFEFVSEGLFNHYIGLQDYKPVWVQLEPMTEGRVIDLSQC